MPKVLATGSKTYFRTLTAYWGGFALTGLRLQGIGALHVATQLWLVGQPDVTLRKIHRGQDTGLWEVEVHGFDYYNPSNGKIESGDTSRIAMWLLDTNYDGRSLLPRQVFFPMAGEKDGWARLAKNLKAEVEAYRGTVSLPFDLGTNRRIAAKIIDDRGIECLKIINVER